MRRLTALLAVFTCAAQTQDVIRSPRPLADAVHRLQQRLGKTVTYEEFVRVWPEELASEDPFRKWNLIPKIQTLLLPPPNPDLEQSVHQTVEVFNQSSNGTHFEVLKSKYGIHIVPRRIHNERGELMDGGSPLDVVITVPDAQRAPREQLLALGEAITAATGTRIAMDAPAGSPNAFNNYFPKLVNQPRWGVRSQVARDALIDILSRSTRTWSWSLKCQPSYKAADRFCALNPERVE